MREDTCKSENNNKSTLAAVYVDVDITSRLGSAYSPIFRSDALALRRREYRSTSEDVAGCRSRLHPQYLHEEDIRMYDPSEVIALARG